jgi:DNA-directed RNA polymerase subunit L
MTKLDLNVSLNSHRAHDDIKRGLLVLNCSGEDCNIQFINSIGRIAVERLASYAFPDSLIKIERIDPDSGYHDSIPFNYDMMRIRLMNTPVIGIDPGFAILHERYWNGIDYKDPNRPIHEQEKRIEVYVDAKNTADINDHDSILHVTTNDIKMHIDGELKNPYSQKYPLLLISLKPKEAFRCSMRAAIGVGVNHTCWDACSNFYFDLETDPGTTIVTFQGSSQFDEFTLVSRALEYFRDRAMRIKDETKKQVLLQKEITEQFTLVLKNETHTMGEPINYEIQSHPDIIKSSVTKPNLLENVMILDIFAKDHKTLLPALMESFDNLINKIDHFEREYMKLGKTKNAEKPSASTKKIKSKKS